MPRSITVAHPIIDLYLREARFTHSEEMVARGILNRWCVYLQEGCAAKCCAHREGRTVKPAMALRSDGVDYLNHLKRAGKAVATTNNALVKLRKFYDWMVRTNEIGKVKKVALPNPFATIKGDAPVRSLQPVLREDAYAKMLKACDDSADELIARRDRAILSLLMWGGLRREEITKLDRCSYEVIDGRPFMVVGTVQRTTKKRRARRVPLVPDVAAYLDRYLLRRDDNYSDDPDSPLFMSQRGDRLTAQGVSQLFDRKKAKAGITGKLGVQSTRRGFTIASVKADMSDRDVAIINGWRRKDGSVNTDMVSYYLQNDADDLAYDAFFTKMAPKANTLQDSGRQRKPGKWGKKAA